MRTVTVKLPEDLDRALTEFDRLLNSSRSSVVREAIRNHLRDRRATAGTLARDLAGCLDGPHDLSTSFRHMAEYGK